MVEDTAREPGDGTDLEGSETEGGQPGRLRSPLIADGQPAFHWWLLLPGVGVALLWAAYRAVTAEDGGSGEFASQLLWPGVAVFLATTVAAYLGWRVDLD
jgi:hypothetical protein